jgi:hypothetical protein
MARQPLGSEVLSAKTGGVLVRLHRVFLLEMPRTPKDMRRMTCQTLVHEHGCKHPGTTKELLDVGTRHASGEEAVGAIFI